MSDTHCPAAADTSQPIPLNKTGKQGSANRTSDVMIAFGPIQTWVSEGASKFRERIDIQIQTSQETFSLCGDMKRVCPVEKSTSAQKFVSYSDREYACEMVIACARKADLWQRGSCRIMSQCSQGFNCCGHIAVFQTKKSLPPIAL
jgi:hypothetical protein